MFKFSGKESIFDADARKELRQSGDTARWAPAGGLIAGAGAFGFGAGKMIGNYRPGFLKNLSKATALSALPAVGVWAGAKYQTYKRDKYVASLPEGNKFKRLYTKNRQGKNPTDDKKIKDWNKAYNLHVVEPKKYPLTKEQKYITEVMTGTPVKKIF